MPLYEFQPSFTVDQTDLTLTSTGSGVHFNKAVTVDLGILDRISGTVSSNAELLANNYVNSISVDILNINGSSEYTNFLTDYKSNIFTFTEYDNINVFGKYTKDFGVRFTLSESSETYTSEFYLYGNLPEFSGIQIQDSTGTTFHSSSESSKTAVNSTGQTGALTSVITFNNDIAYTAFNRVDVYSSSSSSEFASQINPNPIFSRNLTNEPIQSFDINEGSLPSNTPVYLHYVPYANLGSGAAWTVGPYTFEDNPAPTTAFLTTDQSGNFVQDIASVLAVGNSSEVLDFSSNKLVFNVYGSSEDVSRNSVNSFASVILLGTKNKIFGDYDAIVGGTTNVISGDATNPSDFNFIGAGSGNDITGSSYASTIGGYNNDIFSSDYSILGGGYQNLIQDCTAGFIGGGFDNTISAHQSVIAGGVINLITGDGYSFIGGGEGNEIYSIFGSILGGENNIVSGNSSSVLGGESNRIYGSHSFIAGGAYSKVSGDYANAIGRRIQIQDSHDGALVLADGQNRDHNSTIAHSATLDFANGVYINTGNLTVEESITMGGNIVLTGITSAEVIEALGYTPLSTETDDQTLDEVSNPREGITSAEIIDALGYTPLSTETDDQTLDDVLAQGNTSSRDMQVETVTGFQFEATGEVGLYLTGPYAKIRSDGNIQLQTDDTDVRATFGDNYFYLKNNGANDVFRMVGGDAIIGSNTTPSKKLTVVSDGMGDGLQLETTSGNHYATLTNGNSETFPVGSFNMFWGSSNTFRAGANNNEGFVRGGSSAAGKLSLQCHTQTVATVRDGGIGIFYTDPNYELDVSGSGHFLNNLVVDGDLDVTGDITMAGNTVLTGITSGDVTGALGYTPVSVNDTGDFVTSSETGIFITGYTVTEADVTGHQAALTITESQISDLGSYLTGVSESDVTQHEGALTLTSGQITGALGFSPISSETDSQDLNSVLGYGNSSELGISVGDVTATGTITVDAPAGLAAGYDLFSVNVNGTQKIKFEEYSGTTVATFQNLTVSQLDTVGSQTKIVNSRISVGSSSVFGFHTGSTGTSVVLGFSRVSDSIIGVGNGTVGNTSGSLSLANLTASGTVTQGSNVFSTFGNGWNINNSQGYYLRLTSDGVFSNAGRPLGTVSNPWGVVTCADLSASGTVTAGGNVTIAGDLTVNGTTTTINSTTVQVDDKNIELGTVATPTNTTADGGGITLLAGSSESDHKTIKWINSTNAWTFSNKVSTSEITTASGTLTLNPAGGFVFLPSGKKLYGSNIGFGYQSNAVSAIKFLLGPSIDNPDMRIERSSSNLLIQNEVADGDILFKGSDGGSTITALTLDMSAGGNATFAGSVTATSLIKSGGISSEFLKADGSVDSNTYLTTSSASSTYLPLAGGTMTGNVTFPSPDAINFVADSDTGESHGITARRTWKKTVSAGNLQKLGKWTDTEGTVQMLITVGSETSGNSGTSTYLWGGGFNSFATGYRRLRPITDHNGHGDGADDGTNDSWHVYLKQETNYIYSLSVAVPTGANNKNLRVTCVELAGGNDFTDMSSDSALAMSGLTISNSDQYSLNTVNIKDAIYLGGNRKDSNWDAAYTHVSATNNPHSVTASQVGAYTSSEVNTLLDGKSPTAGSTSLTTVGTIGTGTWQGTAIASAYLDADTAHLSATQTFTGAKTFSVDAVFNGNVGIGTTTPTEKLEVNGNLKISSIGTGNSASSYDLLFYGTTSTGTQTDQAAIYSTPWSTNSNAGNLIFETSNTSNALAERMRIDGAGNVGIGTAAPNYKLDIAGNVNVAGSEAYITFNAGGSHVGNIAVKDESGYKLGLQTYNSTSSTLTTKMVLDTNGNVGIGTTSPNEKLDVVGNIKSSGTVTANSGHIYGPNTAYSLKLNADVVLENGASARAIGLKASEVRMTGNTNVFGWAATSNVNTSNINVGFYPTGNQGELGLGYNNAIGTGGRQEQAGHLKLTNLTASGTVTATGVTATGTITVDAPAGLAAGYDLFSVNVNGTQKIKFEEYSGTTVATFQNLTVSQLDTVGSQTKIVNSRISVGSSSVFGFHTGSTGTSVVLGFSRVSDSIIGVGNGTVGNTSGSLSLANLTASGTVTAASFVTPNVGNNGFWVTGNAVHSGMYNGGGLATLSFKCNGSRVLNLLNASQQKRVELETTGELGFGSDTTITRLAAETVGLTNLTASGTVTAGGLIKSGGSSGEFLKADGSVDSNSYLTSLGTAILDGDFTVTGLMKRTGAGTYTSITDNSSDWNTAYTHTSATNNPHSVTATQVGLGNVTNESKATMFTNPTFTGNVGFSHKKVYGFSRTLPTTVNDIVEIGNATVANGGGHIIMQVVVPSSGFSVAKSYTIPIAYSESTSWGILNSTHDTGPYSSNDFEVDIQVSGNVLKLRLRRTSGSTSGTAYINLEIAGTSPSFTETSSTASVTTPTDYYNPNVISQKQDGLYIAGTRKDSNWDTAYTHVSATNNPHSVTASQVGAYTSSEVNTLLDGKSPTAGSTSLTTVGTIGTGTWQGTAIASAYLDADTAHLSGTQTFSGAKTFSAIATFSGSETNFASGSMLDWANGDARIIEGAHR
jgi:hypothetical protein